jgi:hypothetical protein
MSLFDVIRYSNTNLGSEAELMVLPEDLMELYWKKITGPILNSYQYYIYTHEHRCRAVGSWYRDAKKEVYSQLFKQALTEYNPEETQ